MKIPLSTRWAFGLQELLISSSVWSCLVLLVAIVFLDSHEGQVSHFAPSKQCFLLACRFFSFRRRSTSQKKTENKAPCISFLAAKQLFMLTHGLMKSRKLQVCPQIRNRSACELSILDFDMMHLPQPSNWSSCTSNLTSFSYIYQLQDALRLHPFLFIRGMSGGCLGGPGVSASSSSLSYDSSEPLDQSWQQGYL